MFQGKIETADIGEADFSQDNDFQTSKKRFRTPTGVSFTLLHKEADFELEILL